VALPLDMLFVKLAKVEIGLLWHIGMIGNKSKLELDLFW
jgi:hypothetical protein